MMIDSSASSRRTNAILSDYVQVVPADNILASEKMFIALNVAIGVKERCMQKQTMRQMFQ